MRMQVLAGLVALGIAAGAAPADAQDARAADVLAAARKAIGDRKLDSLKALSVQAHVQRNVGNFKAQTDVELALEMPDKFVRTDVPPGALGLSISSGFNGEQAILPANARMSPGGGAMTIVMGGPGAGAAAHGAEKPTPEQAADMNRASLRGSRHEISRLMLGWFAMAHPALKARYTYAGEAESPDGKAHVIDVKDDDGFSARLFLDQQTNLPLMVTYKGRVPRMVTSSGPRTAGAEAAQREGRSLAAEPPALVDISLFFDDWREVDGVRFPHVVRRASEGNTTEEWTINKVKVNPKLDAKMFAVGSR